MKTQLEKELKDLAVEVLSMQNQNINDLKHKVAQIYERLCVLAYTEKQALTNTIPQPETTPEKEFTTINEVTDFVSSLTEETDQITPKENFDTKAIVEREMPSTSETKPISEIISEIIPKKNDPPVLNSTPNEQQSIKKEATIVTEKKDTTTTEVPAKAISDNTPETLTDQTTNRIQNSPELLHELETLTAGFDFPEFDPVNSTPNHDNSNTTIDTSNVTESTTPNSPTKINEAIITQQKSSLNDRLKKSIQIGLNDRIGFIKHLFDGNQDDYTRVLSQLNTFETNTEAINFINQMVKPEYNNWENKEAFETRFLEVVFRKFDTL